MRIAIVLLYPLAYSATMHLPGSHGGLPVGLAAMIIGAFCGMMSADAQATQ